MMVMCLYFVYVNLFSSCIVHSRW